MAQCCCCNRLRRSNKVVDSSTSETADEKKREASAAARRSAQSVASADTEFTEVDLGADVQSEDLDIISWSVTNVFKRIFHAAPDSKLALKFYGSKRGVLNEIKRQDVECCSRWMIHPCSHFRSAVNIASFSLGISIHTCR